MSEQDDQKSGQPFVGINLNTILTSACLAGILYVGSTMKDLTVGLAKLETKDAADDRTMVMIQHDLEKVKQQYVTLSIKLEYLTRTYGIQAPIVDSGDESISEVQSSKPPHNTHHP